MTLQTTASVASPLKMSEVVTELGGPGNLLAYKKPSVYVIDITANANVPSTTPINLTDFLGASAVGFGADIGLVASVGSTFNGQCNCNVTVSSTGIYSGTATVVTGGTGAYTQGSFSGRKWRSGYGVGANTVWYTKATLVSGSAPTSGSGLGVWVNLSTTNASWQLGGAGDKICTIRIAIASAASDASIIDTMDATLESLAAGIN